MKCEHPLRFRQAIGGGVESCDYAPYAIVCLKCGKIVFSGYFSKDSSYPKPKLLFDATVEGGE